MSNDVSDSYLSVVAALRSRCYNKQDENETLVNLGKLMRKIHIKQNSDRTKTIQTQRDKLRQTKTKKDKETKQRQTKTKTEIRNKTET